MYAQNASCYPEENPSSLAREQSRCTVSPGSLTGDRSQVHREQSAQAWRSSNAHPPFETLSLLQHTAMAHHINTAALDGGLSSCLTQAKCHAEIIAVIKKLKIESLSDFVYYVEESKWEEDLKPIRDQAEAPVKTCGVALARLRAAWKAASEALKQQVTATPTQDDLDLPLGQSISEELTRSWTAVYSLELHLKVDPADVLVARCYREFKRNSCTVIPVEKAKSIYEKNRATPTRDQIDVGNIRLEIAPKREVVIRDTIDYYWGLRVLGNAYAKAGNWLVPRKSNPSEQIRFAPLGINMRYADEALNYVLKSGLNGTEAVSWIRERDHLTRGHMISFMKDGLSQGEALEEAMREHKLEWSFSRTRRESSPPPHRPNTRPSEDTELSPPTKRPRARKELEEPNKPKVRLATTLKGGLKICKKFHEGKCTKEEKRCPDKNYHRCDRILESGSVCGKPHMRCGK